jgi:trigger factor
MQVTESVAAGLKRELKIVVGQGELGERFNSRLNSVKDNIQLKGFRKGKVPTTHIKKVYGRSIMAEVVQAALDETSRKAIEDRKERAAYQPKIDLTEDKDEIEKIIAGQADLAYTLVFEVLPEIKLADFATFALERAVVDVSDDAVSEGVQGIAKRATTYEIEDGRAAEQGDEVKIDFVGRVDGVEFPGGKGEDMALVIGNGGFIPGFEDGLKGAKAGNTRDVTATFPEQYPEASLAGKTAVFETKVRSVAKPKSPAIDDEFAKSFGFEDLAKLRDYVRGQIQGEYENLTRTKLKREILDLLDKSHSIELPQLLVDNEFNGIWEQITEGLKRAEKTFESEGKTEDQARDEYRKLAERRVRLGLVIGEIGQQAKVQVSQDELRKALIDEARRYPGQERMVYEFYEKNSGALNNLRAPIFEDKVIDHIVSIAKPVEKKVTRDELLKAATESDEQGGG